MRPRRYRTEQVIGLVVFTSLLGAFVTVWLVGLADVARCSCMGGELLLTSVGARALCSGCEGLPVRELRFLSAA